MLEKELEEKNVLLSQSNNIGTGEEDLFKELFKIEFDLESAQRKGEILSKLGGVEGIIQTLRTDKDTGLSDKNEADLEWRITKLGSNEKPEIPERSYFGHLCDALRDEMLIILLIAAAVSLIIGLINEGTKTGWIEGSSIFLTVLIIVNITAFTNKREENEFIALNKLNRARSAEIVRDGIPHIVDSQIILAGDIINFKCGDVVDVDAIIIQAKSLEVDESALTGESRQVRKQAFFALSEESLTSGPLLYSGSSVKKGNCKAVAVGVGANSAQRQNEKDLDSAKLTPLQEKLDELKDVICFYGFVLSSCIGIILILKEIGVRWFKGLNFIESGFPSSVVQVIMTVILLLVVALPEGLPMAVTLSLVHSTRKMKKENNLVKYIQSCETMGNVNELCSDKTGTLTTGEMVLAKAFIFNTEHDFQDTPHIYNNNNYNSNNHNVNVSDDFKHNIYDLNNNTSTNDSAVINNSFNSSYNQKTTDMKTLDFMHLNILNNISDFKIERDGKVFVQGSITDQGYLNYLNKKNIKASHYIINKSNSNKNDNRNLIKMDFDSDEKFMASVIYIEKQRIYRILLKGAYDFFAIKGRFSRIVSNCTLLHPNFNYQNAENSNTSSGETETEIPINQFQNIHSKNNFINPFENYLLNFVPFNKQNTLAIENYLEKASENCLRTIFFGFKDVPEIHFLNTLTKHNHEPLSTFKELLENDVNLAGLCSFYDPPRENVEWAIEKCLIAGVNLRMITGDDLKTAISISHKIGILNEFQYQDILEQQTNIKKILQISNSNDFEYAFKNDTNKEANYSMNDNYYSYLKSLARVDKLYCLDGFTFNKISGGFSRNPDFDKSEGISKDNAPYILNDPDAFALVTKQLRVIARCSYENKLLLVIGLKQLGATVAVTGDGTNDAVALKNSDVGFAMGIRGSEVAKCAADIILLDDSFLSIPIAIKYGRNVFDSVKKFVQFQLTVNLVAIIITLIGGLATKDSPFNSVQMLWVNLILDSFAALALATEPPSEALFNRKPIKRDAKTITSMMLINILSQATFQVIVLVVILFAGDKIFKVPSDRDLSHYTWNNNVGRHFTILFNVFVFLQVFNSINSRKLLKQEVNVFQSIFNNPLYFGIQGFIVLIQIIIVQFGGRAFRTQSLTFMQHLSCILIASLSLVVGFIVKVLPYKINENETQENSDDSDYNHKNDEDRKNASNEYIKLALD